MLIFGTINSKAIISNTIHLQLNLNKIFSNKSFTLNLSRQTKIYPQLFSQKLVKQFLDYNGVYIYQEYISSKSRTLQVLGKSQLVGKVFQSYPTYYNLIPMIQCYIDWINREKLQNLDDFYNNRLTMEIFDLKKPNKWFQVDPGRKFIYHHGPTNSGKTSAALTQLKKLDKSKKGIYMAPLRLLAWEMQQKLGNCNLITGQDKQYKLSNLTSCTIQTFKENQEYDTAIIDQIQMIGDRQRGWAWTKAILGLKAKRIHLCGDQRALNIISKLVKLTGGTLQERRYSRLSKLLLIHKKYQLKDIEPGDCLIKFNVKDLILLRNDINNFKLEQSKYQKQTQLISPTAIVYGRLPSQCRKIQANNFNANISPYIVATNAIGMGLNLNIKKIIFMGISRKNFNGDVVDLQQHQIQQIAGRAGRGQSVGYVQCADSQILQKVRKALKHVNKTYGINFQDLKAQSEKQKNSDQDEVQKLSQKQLQDKEINQFLKRPLLQNQKKILNAGLFVQIQYIKKVKIQLEYLYKKKISLKTILSYIFNLSLYQKELFSIVSKKQLFQIIQILEPFQLEIQDQFELAMGLSMQMITNWTKKIILSYAKQFKQNFKVDLPISQIRSRNISKSQDQSFNLMRLQENYSSLEAYTYLWDKYQFAFWDIENAKLLKQQIVQKMKKILQTKQPFKVSIKVQKDMKSNNYIEDLFSFKQSNQNQKIKKINKDYEIQKSFHRNALKSKGTDQKIQVFFHRLQNHELSSLQNAHNANNIHAKNQKSKMNFLKKSKRNLDYKEKEKEYTKGYGAEYIFKKQSKIK